MMMDGGDMNNQGMRGMEKGTGTQRKASRYMPTARVSIASRTIEQPRAVVCHLQYVMGP